MWISFQDRIPDTKALSRADLPGVPTLLAKIQLRQASQATRTAQDHCLCQNGKRALDKNEPCAKAHLLQGHCGKRCLRLTSNTWNTRNNPSLRAGEDPVLRWRGNAAPASQGFASCLTCPACCLQSVPGLDCSSQLSTKTHKFKSCHRKESGQSVGHRMYNINMVITVLNLA